MIELAGRRIAICHILYEGGKLTKDGRTFREREHPDVCIFGHTHQPRSEWLGKTLLFNPGSAGPRRFSLPCGVGLLTITQGKVMPRLICLSDKADHQSVGSFLDRSKQKGAVR